MQPMIKIQNEPMLHYYTTSNDFASKRQWDEFIQWCKNSVSDQDIWKTSRGFSIRFYTYPSVLVKYLKQINLSMHNFKIVTASDGYADCKE